MGCRIFFVVSEWLDERLESMQLPSKIYWNPTLQQRNPYLHCFENYCSPLPAPLGFEPALPTADGRNPEPPWMVESLERGKGTYQVIGSSFLLLLLKGSMSEVMSKCMSEFVSALLPRWVSRTLISLPARRHVTLYFRVYLRINMWNVIGLRKRMIGQMSEWNSEHMSESLAGTCQNLCHHSCLAKRQHMLLEKMSKSMPLHMPQKHGKQRIYAGLHVRQATCYNDKSQTISTTTCQHVCQSTRQNIRQRKKSNIYICISEC